MLVFLTRVLGSMQMNDMELTIEKGESLKVHAYIRQGKAYAKRTIHIWFEDEKCEEGERISISAQHERGMHDEARLVIASSGVSVEKMKHIKTKIMN